MELCWKCGGIGGIPLSPELPALERCPECDGAGELPCQAIAVEVGHPDDEPHRILIEG